MRFFGLIFFSHNFTYLFKQRNSSLGIRILGFFLKMLDPDPHEMNADPQPLVHVLRVFGQKRSTFTFYDEEFLIIILTDGISNGEIRKNKQEIF